MYIIVYLSLILRWLCSRTCSARVSALGTVLRASFSIAKDGDDGETGETWGCGVGTRLENLESFPGPFGRVDGSTTEVRTLRTLRRYVKMCTVEVER